MTSLLFITIPCAPHCTSYDLSLHNVSFRAMMFSFGDSLLTVQFEADRRAFNITINSFGTELTKDDRVKLYPTIGLSWIAFITTFSRFRFC